MIKVHDAYSHQKHNSLFENISKLISVNSFKMNTTDTSSANMIISDKNTIHHEKNKRKIEEEKIKLLQEINKGFRQTLLHADERLKIAEIMYTNIKLLSDRLEEDLLAIEEERRIETELGISQEEIVGVNNSFMENDLKSNRYNSMRKKRKITEPITAKRKKNERGTGEYHDAGTTAAMADTAITSTTNADIIDGKNPLSPPTIIFNPNGQGISEILEPKYCICNEPSFGEMIACDNENCSIEWFHCQCVGVSDSNREKNKDKKWYCPDCSITMMKQ